MLARLLAVLALLCAPGLAAASGIAVVYLGTNDCPYCQHWEARAKGELTSELRGSEVRYYEIKGETLRRPIVERHYPDELKWLARKLGPSRGVPRFILLVDGEVAWSVFGTNDYEKIFLPALRQAMARRNDRAGSENTGWSTIPSNTTEGV
ncbi:MAG: thioredoxin family protein [Betaproteobacteria bacterium]|nr:thioredoxin family protein [Betaproteobacteria bacterium]